jgi:hypothetical protein
MFLTFLSRQSIMDLNKVPEARTKRDEKSALVEAVNQAFEEAPPTAEEKELLQGIRANQRRRLESED